MRLTTGDFKNCFGGMTPECKQEIRRYDFSYVLVPPPPQNAQNLMIVGDRGRWEDGWAENLTAFSQSHHLDDLIPKYYHPGRPLRYKNHHILGKCPDFELNFLRVFRTYILSFFKSCLSVYEFGCGTGFNLVTLAQMYPKKILHGLDWANSSIKLLEEINRACNLDIKPHLFDMFNPVDLHIGGRSGVLTWGALEQLSDRFEPFLQFLLQRNGLVINIEPIMELYDSRNEMDNYSIQYMNKRRYLSGYLTRLWQLEAEGRISIQTIQRQHFGNANYEGWSFIIWRPIPSPELGERNDT